MFPFAPIVALAAESAAAPPAAECVDAADRGQRARKDGKLQDARDWFLSCAAPMCPESVQKDCLHWANDAIDLVPSIVVDATDEDGHDIGDAKVIIDGYEAANVTEGLSITLDPGAHAVRVEKPGFYPVEKSDDRDIVRGLGWTSIAVGGAATITGLFAYFSEPAKPRIRAGVTITPAGAFGRF